VAGLLITTEAMIAEKPEKKKEMPPMRQVKSSNPEVRCFRKGRLGLSGALFLLL
jgi:hypothetical protein